MVDQTISEAIGADHKYIDYCADQIRHHLSSRNHTEATKWRNQIVWTFARHAISEELTMYPTMVEKLGEEGKKMTETDLEQHQAIKEDLYKLQSMSTEDSEFAPLLETLMKDFHDHVEHESQVDMPAFEAILTTQESIALAKYFQRTKKMTPTRSHPSAPNKPWLENIAALFAAPIDRIGDWVRSFPEDPEPEAGTPAAEEQGGQRGDPKSSKL